MENKVARYIRWDVHKAYFVAVGVNAQREVVFGPRKVSVYQLKTWTEKHLRSEDAVVLEVTTNAYRFHDVVQPYVSSVTVAHPPHVKLVTHVPVKTDRKAALAFAERQHLRLRKIAYADDQCDWWEHLPLTEIELLRVRTDLDTLALARE